MEHLSNNQDKVNDNLADQLNKECYCRTLDRKVLNTSLQNQLSDTRDNPIGANELNKIFSATPVFVPKTEIETMVRIVAAIESAAIEINTNAGGAFLNVALARAQKQCCHPSEQSADTTKMLDGFEEAVTNMFIQEWQRQSATAMPNRIAIIDNDPKSQFMYLEFQLACRLLQAKGIDTVILDPSEINYVDGKLTAHGKPIDMIYNRLVDFAFENPNHAVLKSAYLEGAVVVTPNPHVHAIFANKRNLALLSDPQTLQSWGLDNDDAKCLERAVPTTKMVIKEDAAELWRTRGQLFFKPVAGYGSKGVYRGSKLTRRVFENILDEDYIAQTFIPATERSIKIDDVVTTKKVDIRLYTYAGQLLLTAGRIYQGQATNFRTPGGGFAPVFQV